LDAIYNKNNIEMNYFNEPIGLASENLEQLNDCKSFYINNSELFGTKELEQLLQINNLLKQIQHLLP
jgi:hypothetical protein